MQCVGTLSWNGMGLATPARTRGGVGLSLRLPAKPSRRTMGAPGIGAPLTPVSGPGAIQAGHIQGGKMIPPEARQPEIEADALEIGGAQDWTQLVRRCMDGDSGAWAELVRTHHRRVYGLCYRFTGNPADAEDLTQDVFLKVYSNLASFDTLRGSLQVWITTMTRNLLVDNFRRTRNLRATGSLDDGWESAETLKPVDRLVARDISPHESAAQKELAKMVQEALARVSVELREAVILRDYRIWTTRRLPRCWTFPKEPSNHASAEAARNLRGCWNVIDGR